MWLTETEARGKICCGPAHKSPHVNNMCQASNCMAWRWSDLETHPDEPPVGFCGLGGEPLEPEA